MSSDYLKRDLARLDIGTLIERGRAALDSDDPRRAVVYIRTAVRRAPLREDLRRLMGEAISRGVDIHDEVLAERLAAEMEREAKFNRANEAPDYDDDDDGDEDIPIEPPRRSNSSSQSRTAAASKSPRRDLPPVTFEAADAPGARAQQDPRLFDPRAQVARRRRSGSPLLLALTFLAFVGIVAAVVYQYLQQPPPDPLALNAPPPPPPAEEVDDTQALIQMARDLEEQEMFALAIEKYSMIAEGPEKARLLAEAYSRQGDRYAKSGRYNLARDAFRSALDHQPGNPDYAYRLGQTHWTLGRQIQPADDKAAEEHFDQSERYLLEALEADEAHLGALESLARVAIARGDAIGAATHLRRIVELDPKSPEAEKARQVMTQRGFSF